MPPRLPRGFWRDLKKEVLNPVTYLWQFSTGYAFYLGAKGLGYVEEEKGFAELHQLADTRRNAAGKGETSSEAQAGDQDTRSGSRVHTQAVNPATGRIAYGVEYLLTLRPFNSLWPNQSRSKPSYQ